MSSKTTTQEQLADEVAEATVQAVDPSSFDTVTAYVQAVGLPESVTIPSPRKLANLEAAAIGAVAESVAAEGAEEQAEAELFASPLYKALQEATSAKGSKYAAVAGVLMKCRICFVLNDVPDYRGASTPYRTWLSVILQRGGITTQEQRDTFNTGVRRHIEAILSDEGQAKEFGLTPAIMSAVKEAKQAREAANPPKERKPRPVKLPDEVPTYKIQEPGEILTSLDMSMNLLVSVHEVLTAEDAKWPTYRAVRPHIAGLNSAWSELLKLYRDHYAEEIAKEKEENEKKKQ